MNKDDRPRERLVAKGAAALSNAELTAILLRSGGAGVNVLDMSRDLLVKAGSLTGLSMMSLDKMMEVRGQGCHRGRSIRARTQVHCREDRE